MRKAGLMRNAALAIALMLLLSVLAACSDNAAPNKEGNGNNTPPATENNEGGANNGGNQGEEPGAEAPPAKEPVDLGGYEFVIASLWDWEIFPEEGMSEQADLIYERYKQIEEDYNVTITLKKISPETIMEDINSAVMAGDKFADFIKVDYGRFQNLQRNGMIRSLDDIAGFDIGQAKFYPSVTESAKRSGNVYGIDYQVPPYVGIMVYYNKSLLEREGLGDPAELVGSMQWTWEKFKELAIGATKDKNGDGLNDLWGLVTTDWIANNMEKPFIWTNNGRVATQGADGKYQFAMGEPEVQETLSYLNDLLYVNKVLKPNQQGSDPNQNVQDFVEGKVAFMINPSYAPEAWLTNMEDDFGVLPLPMGPKADDYVALGNELKLWVMTTTNANADKAAIIFDAISEPLRGSLEADQDAYYDEFRLNILRDDASLDVFKMMSSKTIADATWGMAGGDIIANAIYSVARDNSATAKSAIESISGIMQGYIDDFFMQVEPEEAAQ